MPAEIYPQMNAINSYCLAPCPKKLNCVSSLAEQGSEQYVDAFQFSDNPEADLQLLQSIMSSMAGIGEITVKQNYLHAQYRSRLFRFIDDLEFYWDEHDQLCHVRSASRLGYYDFGVNRKRVESIRAEFMRRKNI